MVYRLALGRGAVHGYCGHSMGLIGIQNMDPIDHGAYKNLGRLQGQTSYPAMTHTAPCCSEHDHLDFDDTSYRLGPMQLPGLGLLRVNRHIRTEALPIFYGENIFSFGQMSAVRPFLKDRPAVARRNIQHIQLYLDLRYRDGHYRERQNGWVKVFKYLAHHLNIKKLDIILCDMTLNFLKPVKFVGWKREWVRSLLLINNLHQFSFEIEFLGREAYVEAMLEDLDEDEIDDEMLALQCWEEDTEFEYVTYFRSRMLKKTQSSIDGWLREHVCGPQCKEIRKGREASKSGLPRSKSHGLWTLPEVDTDALYDSSEVDDLEDDEEYSDTEYWTAEDDETSEDKSGKF